MSKTSLIDIFKECVRLQRFHAVTCSWIKVESYTFPSLRFFGLLSSSLLLFPQCFGRYVLQMIVSLEAWRLQVQSSLQVSNNTGILSTCTRLWLTESEQATPVVSIKDVVRSSVKVPEFNKHLKNAGGHIGQNVVEITIKMKTIVWKTLKIKINKFHLRNLDNLYISILIWVMERIDKFIFLIVFSHFIYC